MIKKTDVQDMYFLSPMQEGMLFHYLMDKSSPVYFEQMSYSISGEIENQLFEQAFMHIIDRYDILRTIFIYDKVKRPMQVVLRKRKPAFYYEDISYLHEMEKENRVKEFKIKDRKRGFDLMKDILIRLSILKTAEKRYEVIWSFHHIIMDGWCTTILIKDILLIYHDLKQGKTINLPPTVPYKNYIKWLEKQDEQAGIYYWQHYLENYENRAIVPSATLIPGKKDKGESKYELREYRFGIGKSLTRTLDEIANGNNVTVNTIFQTLWGILLQKYNNTDDVVFWSVVSGRPADIEGIETMVGLFINAIPIRIKSEPGEVFDLLLKKVQAQMLRSKMYEYVPLAEIQSKCLSKRDLVNHLVIFENYPLDREIKHLSQDRESGFLVESVDVFAQTNYELNVLGTLSEELFVNIKYNSTVYENQVIERIKARLVRLFQQIGTDPGSPVGKLEIVSEEEKNQLLYGFNNSEAVYPASETIHGLFREQVEKSPYRIALVYGETQAKHVEIRRRGQYPQSVASHPGHLTYQKLNQMANRLAHSLKERNVNPDDIVGIMMAQSTEMIIGILGILKAGGAFLPIDGDYPGTRIKYMLGDSNAKVLVTTRTFARDREPDGWKGEKLFLEDIPVSPVKKKIPAARNSQPITNPNHLCYAIYTSGTTGKPKGVSISHNNLVNYVNWFSKAVQLSKQDKALLTSSFAFDLGYTSLFPPLLTGGDLHLVPKEMYIFAETLCNYIEANGITYLKITPSLFATIVDVPDFRLKLDKTLRLVLLGGESINVSDVEKLHSQCRNLRVMNHYGPSESTIGSAAQFIDFSMIEEYRQHPTIGHPIHNTRIYILGRNLELMPPELPGELCISGDGLARGYLNSPGLTREKFVPNPFLEGDIIYKTGDLAAWLPGGNIEFMGRIDHQVKIRGFRIELGEIESQLLKHEYMDEVVVIVKEDKKGEPYLCAYHVSGKELDAPVLRKYLLQKLPDYMIPNYFVQLERFPLTPNGKINRKALPEPDTSIDTEVEYEAPQGKIERILAGIWSEVLGVKNPGINNNFFELGGHSLRAMSIAANIHKQLNIAIPLGEVFYRPTIKELAAYIASEQESIYSSIEPLEEKEYYSLSSAQRRLFVIHQFNRESIAYNVPTVVIIDAQMDVPGLENALKNLIRRHQALRTSCLLLEAEPVQIIHTAVTFKLEYYEADNPGDEFLQRKIDRFIRPFDLSTAPLIRCGLVKLSDTRHLFMVDIHHIVSDGTSSEILIREFFKLYSGDILPELRINYKDYAVWQQQMLRAEKLKHQEEYWLGRFKGEVPILDFPTDYPRPFIKSFEGERINFHIGKELYDQLKQLARGSGVTMYMILLAAFNLLLYKYTSQEDIIVGCPIFGRPHADLQHIVGMFINMLPMWNCPRAGQPFIEFLSRVKENALEVYENQDYQFEELVVKLDLERDVSRNPIYDVTFIMQTLDPGRKEIEGLKISWYEFRDKRTKFDLSLDARELEDQILFSMVYGKKLFKHRTIERLVRHFLDILGEIAARPDKKLKDIEILSETEKNQILYDFNRTKAEYPGDIPVHELFARQVEKIPDHTAVVSSGNSAGITFKDLNRRAYRLAVTLRRKGLKADMIAAIMIERSIEMIVGVMGILKAGGAYLPLDPEYPSNRIKFILADSRADILLISKSLVKKAKTVFCGICLNLEDQTFYRNNNIEAVLPVNAKSLAYVIYTSGSTGKPKGVMVQHGSLVNRLKWMQKQIPLGNHDTILHKTPFTFDVSVWELVWWSLEEARVCLLAPGKHKEPDAIINAIENHRITVIHFVPSMLNVFLEYTRNSGNIKRLLNLKQVVASGEALTVNQVNQFNELLYHTNNCQLINLYGPTEAAIDVSYFDCTGYTGEEKSDNIPIGKPIDNIYLLIVSRDMHLQPIGLMGELFIGGEGLARGYLNNPQLTAEKFVEQVTGASNRCINKKFLRGGQGGAVFSKSAPPGGRRQNVYKTGDLACWLWDGNIQFLGRRDHQVKIRGFRIELGEIESVLLEHDMVKEGVVIDKGNGAGDRYLCAYVVAQKDFDPLKVKEHLSNRLPEYMVPNYFVPLKKIPLTPHGKLDRKELPEPRLISTDGYTTPQNQTQQQMAEVWKQALNLKKIGITDNFFQIGGDSLKAIRLISLVNNKFNTNLGIIHLYTGKTIKGLEDKLNKQKPGNKDEVLREVLLEIRQYKNNLLANYPLDDEIEEVYPMSDIERGMCFHYLKEFNDGVYHDQPVYQHRFKDFDIKRMKKAAALMIKKHPALRSAFNLEEFSHVVYKYKESFTDSVVYRDISGREKVQQEDSIRGYARKSRSIPFDMSTPPLWRMGFFKSSRENIVLVWDYHHSILDGWSNALFLTELNNTYLQLKLEPNFVPAPIKAGYNEFIIDQMCQKKDAAVIDYWKHELMDYKRLDFPRTSGKNDLKEFDVKLGLELRTQLEVLAEKKQVPLKHLCFAAYAYTMNMFAYENDITVGLVTNVRPLCEDADYIVGCFLNTVPVRINIPSPITWLDFIKLVDGKMLQLVKYDKLSLLEIAKALGEKTDYRNPIIDMLLNFIDFYVYEEMQQEEIPESVESRLRLEGHERTNFPLEITINTYADNFFYRCKYSTGTISDEAAAQACRYFKNVLNRFIYDIERVIDKDDILSEAEREQLLYKFNNTEEGFSKDKTLHQLFEEQVERTPNHVSVISDEEEIDYTALNSKANRVAAYLRSVGIRQDFVSVVIDRTVDMVVAVLAILKAGGAYVPLEPYLPAQRIAGILAALNTTCILTNHGQLTKLAGIAGELSKLTHIIYLDGGDSPTAINEITAEGRTMVFPDGFRQFPGENLHPVNTAEDIAYIIYTSGSTGFPKGVVLEHRPVVNVIQWVNKTFQVGTADKILLVASISFDLSVYDIFGILACGGTIRMVSHPDIKAPERLLQIIFDEGITFWDSAPAALQQLVPFFPNVKNRKHESKLRLVFLSGDWIPVTLPDALRETFIRVNVIGLGGATEAAIWSNFYPIGRVDASWKSIPYGKPIQNAKYYILDQQLKACSIGVPGDLYIGGSCLATGYINEVELTAAKFIDNPFLPGGIIYKTGDVARWFKDGNIEFLGRKDNQVKLRGLRIELGEIQVQLLKYEKVVEAIVLIHGNKAEDKYLCAYIITDDDHEIPVDQLRDYLAEKLPAYMIPSYFMQIEKIPLTANGKVNRAALPEPVIKASEDYIAPRNEIERKLVKIWTEVLSSDPDADLPEQQPPNRENQEKQALIGIDDDFFELGGHSLKATLIIARIHKELNTRLPLAEIFATPSVRGIAQYIMKAEKDRYKAVEPVEMRDYYPLSSAQKRLYILQQMESASTAYNIPLILALEGTFHRERWEEILKKVIRRHESLRTSFLVVDGQPVQRVNRDIEFEIDYYRGSETPDQETTREIIDSFISPFDLSRPPLLRVGIILSETRHILMIDIHHIVADGVSQAILIQDFADIYQNKGLPPLKIHYNDYSQWQDSHEQKGELKQQEEYWLKAFAGDIPVLNLPLYDARPGYQSFEGNTLRFELGKGETEALNILAVKENTTLYVVLLAIFYVLLAKVSGQEDIIIGSPIAGRRHEDLEKIIGMFVNTLALRNYPQSEKTFSDFLQDLKENTLMAFENQDYPFENLLEQIAVNRDFSRNPLFDVMFALQNMDFPKIEIPGLKLFPYKYKNQISKFDLTLQAVEVGDELFITFEYCTKLFKQETIEKFISYYEKIISTIINNSNQQISQIEIVSDEEKEKILFTFNDTDAKYPQNKTIHELFEEQVERTPDHIAVVFENKNSTYRQLNERANLLAWILRKKGVRTDRIVALMLERSLEMIAGIFAVLKAGGAYLPINPELPTSRVISILEDCQASILITQISALKGHSFIALQGQQFTRVKPRVSAPRQRITNMNRLPMPDRSLVDYENYPQYLGYAGIKNSISLEATRGCPYNCSYCYKLFPNKQVTRSAENIFSEVRYYYDLGIRRFSIIDDIFNLNIKNSVKFFELIMKNRLKVQLFFSAGLRGDILTKDYIDLMVEAGAVSLAPALETASPRLQKLNRKNLNIEKLRENLEYICEKYPGIILELFIMHGFPTETEEEAQMTLDFVKKLQGIHFPYINILRIYSNTDMAKFAIKNGISYDAIVRSEDLAWHELPETLPFSKSFTLKIQTEFLNDYFLSKQRLLRVLPYQMKLLTEDELVKKYNSYLPVDINCFDELLQFIGITKDELGVSEFTKDEYMPISRLNEKMVQISPPQKSSNGALRILLLDLSLYFSNDSDMLYDLVDEPLGLIRLLTYLKQQFGSKINGKIAKSRIDFNSYAELKALLKDFKPDVIGVRTLTFYRELFHRTITLIRHWGIDVPIIVGGPHATSNYNTLLQDQNVDLAVIGEGEITFRELIGQMIKNERKLPDEKILEKIAGIAFISQKEKTQAKSNREIILGDVLMEQVSESKKSSGNLQYTNQPADLAYLIYTSGSTGSPKGVMVEHGNVAAYLHAYYQEFEIKSKDTVIQLASYAFDISVEEFFPILLKGGKLVIPVLSEIMDVYALCRAISRHQVNIVDCTPLLLNELNHLAPSTPPGDLLKSVHTFISGGDVLKKEYVDNILNIGNVYNTYGPTETTVCTAYYNYTHAYFNEDHQSNPPSNIPIGKPISNYEIYILDKNSKYVPIGVNGELCVSGAGVSRGYLNQPELTAENFIEQVTGAGDRCRRKYKTSNQKFLWGVQGGGFLEKSPLGRWRQKTYKTGDIARWLPDGNIEFLGRIDRQVKIRGFRIEQEEIENQLLQHEELIDTVVSTRKNEDGEAYLCAYVVTQREFSAAELREYLVKKLPDYMIPSYFIQVEKIPLTPNGKVDEKALQTLDINLNTGVETALPENETEELIAAAWKEILHNDNVGVNDNFFDVGGHSLGVIRVNGKLREIFQKDIPVVAMFRYPTIRSLARYMDNEKTGEFISDEKIDRSLNIIEETSQFFFGDSDALTIEEK